MPQLWVHPPLLYQAMSSIYRKTRKTTNSFHVSFEVKHFPSSNPSPSDTSHIFSPEDFMKTGRFSLPVYSHTHTSLLPTHIKTRRQICTEMHTSGCIARVNPVGFELLPNGENESKSRRLSSLKRQLYKQSNSGGGQGGFIFWVYSVKVKLWQSPAI